MTIARTDNFRINDCAQECVDTRPEFILFDVTFGKKLRLSHGFGYLFYYAPLAS